MPSIVLGLANASVLTLEKVCVVSSHAVPLTQASPSNFRFTHVTPRVLPFLLGCLGRISSIVNTELNP